MKKTNLVATLTASAALLVAASACGSTPAKTDAPADAAKTGEAHCGAEKGAHEGSCAPGAEKPADPAPAPADGAAAPAPAPGR